METENTKKISPMIETKIENILEELSMITNGITILDEEMKKYHNVVRSMWKEINKFKQTIDCDILEKIDDRETDYSRFECLMLKQKTYRLMQTSYKRLLERRDTLYKSMNDLTK